MEIHASLWTQMLAGILGQDAHTLALWDHVIAAVIVFAILGAMSLLLNSRLSPIPGGFQQLMEVIVEGLLDMLDDNIGEKGKKYLPLVGTLALFIFVANFLGMVPSFSAATGNFNTTVACALIVFIYYNYQGLKEHGLGYVKHFMGPVPALAPIMFPIEIISHLSRPFSLAVRLFCNISGEHLVSLVFYTQLFAWLVPLPIMCIGLFAAFLQAFIFIMLTMVYIAGAIAHEH